MADHDPKEVVTSWGSAGDGAFYCVADGRIVALLYWQQATVGEWAEPGGEPVVMDPEWALLFADDPDNHLTLGLDDRENETAALDAAGRALVQRIGQREAF